MFHTYKGKIYTYIGSLGSNGAGAALGLVNQLLFARLMGVSDYGLLTMVQTIVLLSLSLADLGVASAIPRFLAIYMGEGEHGKIRHILKASALFTMLVSFVLMSALLLLAGPLSAGMHMAEMKTPLIYFVLFIPVLYLNRWSQAALNGLGENGKIIALESFALQAGIFIFSVGAWVLTKSLNWAVVGTGMAYLVTGVLGLIFTLQKARTVPKGESVDKTPFREIILHGLPINITALGQRLFRRGDTLVVGIMLGHGAVGLYQAAYTLTSGIKRLIMPINTLALFYMGHAVGRKRGDMVLRHYESAVQVGLCISLPAYMIFIVMAEDIISIVFGDEYAAAAPVLQILSIGFAALTSVGPMGSLFNVLGKNWLRMWIIIGLCIVNIALNILFIKMIGLSGAALGTTVSFILLNVVFYFFAKRHLTAHKMSVNTFAIWGMAILMTGALYSVSFSSLWTEAAASLAGAAAIFLTGGFVAFKSLLKDFAVHSEMKEAS